MNFEYAEGATLIDADEAAELIPTHLVTMGALNEWEQANIVKAEGWVFARRRPNILHDRFVRELHRRMFDETWKWAGRYRTTDKNIGVHWTEVAVQVRQTCENATFWIAEKVFELDEAAARLHHAMVLVHPFVNGNGRHTRLLADALLRSQSAPRFTWGGGNLQSPVSSLRADYLTALRSADAGDFAPLLRFARS